MGEKFSLSFNDDVETDEIKYEEQQNKSVFFNTESIHPTHEFAHFHSRRAENHLKKRRFDLAIEHHKKTVDLLNKAIEESSIDKNIECLELQRDYHQKYQNIVLMKKVQFLHDIMVQRERLKSTERENSLNKELKSGTDDELNIFVNADGDDEAFSPGGEDRRLIAELTPLELPEFDFGNFEIK